MESTPSTNPEDPKSLSLSRTAAPGAICARGKSGSKISSTGTTGKFTKTRRSGKTVNALGRYGTTALKEEF
jgi:hypothetical protein